MAEQRQPFLSRIRWFSQPPAPPAPAPPAAPRPTADTQIPASQPTTIIPIIPIQRPAFRLAGIAPVQPPPPQAQPTPRTESRPPSPARAPTESRPTSQPASPSRAATQSRAASLPPSPSRTAPQSQPASLPPFPSRPASQPQPVSQTAPQPRSPSRLASQPAGQTLQPTTSQVQPITGVVSLPSGPVAAIAPTSKAVPEAPAPPQTSSFFSAFRTGLKPLPGSEEKTGETKEGKGPVQDQRKEDKMKGPAYEQPKQTTVTKLPTGASGTETQTKEQLSVELQEEQKQMEKQEVRERKETLLTSGSQEKQLKTTQRMDRNTVGESRQKPGIISGERAPLHKEIREDITRFVQKLGIGHPEQIMSEKPVSVITLAGGNRGASMQLGSESAKKEGSIHIQRRYKTNQDTSAETTTDAEGSSEGRISKYPMTKEDPGKKTYINSNIQSINNSILSDSSVTENNPGVHLNLSRNPVESIKSDDKTESFDTHKAEVNITPAEKRTYEPVVRRRCLRGLFMETSDSDPDNPEKPQRHGCRYGCGEKSKDKEIGVL